MAPSEPDAIDRAALEEAAKGPMKGIIEYSTEALVSCDIVGNPHSCIFDAPLTNPGDAITLKAEMDVIMAFSACPQDLLPVNGEMCTPVEAHFEIV